MCCLTSAFDSASGESRPDHQNVCPLALTVISHVSRFYSSPRRRPRSAPADKLAMARTGVQAASRPGRRAMVFSRAVSGLAARELQRRPGWG